eukprot:9455405-Alexandrium_andersonii.AAC.1
MPQNTRSAPDLRAHTPEAHRPFLIRSFGRLCGTPSTPMALNTDTSFLIPEYPCPPTPCQRVRSHSLAQVVDRCSLRSVVVPQPVLGSLGR